MIAEDRCGYVLPVSSSSPFAVHVGKEQNENSISAVAWKQGHATAEIEFSFYLCGGC